MRFHQAVDAVEKENRFLKLAVIGLVFCSLGLAGFFAKASQKQPLIIERGCYLKIVTPLSSEVPLADINTFLKEAIPARFNSDQNAGDLLDADQALARQVEQAQLTKQNFKQVVIYKFATGKDGGFLVDADRLISVGEVRSAFRFPLIVSVRVTERTDSNPYGLVLTDVKVIDDKKQSEK